MCGIFGFSWNNAPLSADRIVLTSMLAWQNEKRGPHSWGYASIGRRGVNINKGLGTFTEHRISKEMAKLNTVMAHTRWKTHGEITIANAHPFRIGSIVGAHNGVIYNHDEVAKKYGREFPVDSMHIFAHLADDLEFSDLRGYGSIEWVDDRYGQNTIFLAKLSDGELAVAKVPDRGIVWSSDKEHLKNALDCAGLGFSLLNIKESEAYKITGGRCYKTGVKLKLAGSGKTWSYASIGGGYDTMTGWPETKYDTYTTGKYTVYGPKKDVTPPTNLAPVRAETYVPVSHNGQKNDRFVAVKPAQIFDNAKCFEEDFKVIQPAIKKAVEVPSNLIGFRGMGENIKGGIVLEPAQVGKCISLTPAQAKQSISHKIINGNVFRLDSQERTQQKLSWRKELAAREARQDPDSCETCWRCDAVFVRVAYDTCPHCQADLTWLDDEGPKQDIVQASAKALDVDMEELIYAFEMIRDKK